MLPGSPPKPVDIDQMKWDTLQDVIGRATPSSAELVGSDSGQYDVFGISLALSGNTALIGASGHTVNSKYAQGAAYVFVFDGTSWVQQQELLASDGAASDAFGVSVALSGGTAVVGAQNKTVDASSGQGAVYVFTLTGSTWTQQQELTASDGAANSSFGDSVAISGDTILVGSYHKTFGTNTFQGAAYVFAQSGDVWSQQQELTATDGAAGDDFGYSVALSGATALVGAYSKTVDSHANQGAAYVFVSNAGTWTQQQELTTSEGAAGDDFGCAMALSGTTALVGAYGKAFGANTFQGAAYVFTSSGDTWTQLQQLTATDGAQYDEFGNSVALSGTLALVGADNKAAAGAMFGQGGEGAAYAFQFSGGKWTQQQQFSSGDSGLIDELGYAVAISGTTAFVGAPNKTLGTNGSQGQTYVFDTDPIFCNGFDGTTSCK
jgi:hypothetical protein